MTPTEIGLSTALIAVFSGCGGILIGISDKLTEKVHSSLCPVNKDLLGKKAHDEVCGVRMKSIHKALEELSSTQSKMFEVLDTQAKDVAILLDRSKEGQHG